MHATFICLHGALAAHGLMQWCRPRTLRKLLKTAAYAEHGSHVCSARRRQAVADLTAQADEGHHGDNSVMLKADGTVRPAEQRPSNN